MGDEEIRVIAPEVAATFGSLVAVETAAFAWSVVKKSPSLTPAPCTSVLSVRVNAPSIPWICFNSIACSE